MKKNILIMLTLIFTSFLSNSVNATVHFNLFVNEPRYVPMEEEVVVVRRYVRPQRYYPRYYREYVMDDDYYYPQPEIYDYYY